MSKQTNQLEPGYIQFYDNETPGLPAGNYSVAATLSLPNTDTDNYSQLVTQEFEVQGPQFVIDSSEIHAMFPAASANGDFSLMLPSVVLESPVLPWERTITSDKTVPWMALLILRADEVEVNPATNSPLINTTVQSFLDPETGIVKPAIAESSVSPDILAGTMNSIRISTAVFQAVTPRLIELSTLAHLREVNPDNQAVAGNDDDGWYSVILANRFPNSNNPQDDAGAINYAHLVSLEGLTAYLVDSPQWPEGAAKVQLASLASWNFVSAEQPGQTFAELAAQLVTAEGNDPASLLLRIPVTNDGSAAATRIQEGYTALSYHTLPGPDTFAWYRGPLTPVPAQPLPTAVTEYLHSSAGMIYDHQNGVFDNSYGAAWTIGRLTALSDPVFSDAVLRTRNKVITINSRLLERSKMPHLAGITDLNLLASPGLTRKMFAGKVKAGMSARLTQSFNAPVQLKATGVKQAIKNFLYPGETPPASPAMENIWFMKKTSVSSFLASQVDEDLDPLAAWLANLALLHNISFNHLVPDQRMLPVESARFFYIDQGWIKVLLDGAMSVGVHGTKELAAQEVIAGPLFKRTLQKTAATRSKLLRVQNKEVTPPQMPVAGMLLRSELVSGWPGLSVKATAGGNTVNIMRMDRVAPNILLVLWDAAPDTVKLSQPEQGLMFGVEDGWIVPRRSLSSSNLGAQLPQPSFPSSGTFTQFMRPVQNDIGGLVLNIVPTDPHAVNYIIPAMELALQAQSIKPSEFAIEMVKTPEEIVFNPPA